MWTQNTKREEGRERRAKRKLRTEELHCFHSSRLTNKGEWFFFGGGERTCSNRCGYNKNLKGQIHSRNAVVGMIILKPIFRKYDFMVSRYIWFVLQTGSC